eukprot:COSAG03_NODE_12822_length_529_cov_1.255814_1_plen_61_part_10
MCDRDTPHHWLKGVVDSLVELGCGVRLVVSDRVPVARAQRAEMEGGRDGGSERERERDRER